MSEPVKRRSLVSLATPLPVVDDADIAAVATRHGFAANTSLAPEAEAPRPSPPRAAPAKPATAEVPRRKKQPLGRDHQFNTRLRRETLDYIYGQANDRGIAIAQVIEEMVETHRREQGRG